MDLIAGMAADLKVCKFGGRAALEGSKFQVLTVLRKKMSSCTRVGFQQGCISYVRYA